jgi:hypothetical protein
MLTVFAGPAAAQELAPPAKPASSASVASRDSRGATPELRQAVKAVRFDKTTPADERRKSAPPSRRTPQMSGVERGIFTAFAGVAGFFAGGYLGAKIEGDCNCDDPGLMGAIIGAPIGAAAAAIVTWIWTGRD